MSGICILFCLLALSISLYFCLTLYLSHTECVCLSFPILPSTLGKWIWQYIVVFHRIFHMPTWNPCGWVIFIDEWSRNVMFVVLEMLLGVTMELSLSSLPIENGNQWNALVKCSDKCTHLCLLLRNTMDHANLQLCIHWYQTIEIVFYLLVWPGFSILCASILASISWTRRQICIDTSIYRSSKRNKSWASKPSLFFCSCFGTSSSHV